MTIRSCSQAQKTHPLVHVDTARANDVIKQLKKSHCMLICIIVLCSSSDMHHWLFTFGWYSTRKLKEFSSCTQAKQMVV